MITTDIEEMINKYFDNELTKNEEVLLFSMLSANPEAIEYFKKMNILRNAIETTADELPGEVEERIMTSIHSITPKKRMTFTPRDAITAGSFLIAVVMIVLSLFLFNQVNDYKKELDYTVKSVIERTNTIELLLNSTLPAVEIKPSHYNEVVIKSTRGL